MGGKAKWEAWASICTRQRNVPAEQQQNRDPGLSTPLCDREAPSYVVVSVEATWMIIKQEFYLRSSEELVIPQPPSSNEKPSSPWRSKKLSKPSEEKPKEMHTNTIKHELLKIKKKIKKLKTAEDKQHLIYREQFKRQRFYHQKLWEPERCGTTFLRTER